jgi:hypothetical protein
MYAKLHLYCNLNHNISDVGNCLAMFQRVENVKRDGTLDVLNGFLKGITAANAPWKCRHGRSIARLRIIREQNNGIVKDCHVSSAIK